MIDETLFEAEEKMERAIEFAKEEFGAIRTGRATPGMFARLDHRLLRYARRRCRRWPRSPFRSRGWC